MKSNIDPQKYQEFITGGTASKINRIQCEIEQIKINGQLTDDEKQEKIDRCRYRQFLLEELGVEEVH
jgi:hypothetical protein